MKGINERTWLCKFGEQVWVHDYMAAGKLDPRAYKARIINYTNTKGIYWIVDKAGCRKLAKNPRSVIDDDDKDEHEEQYQLGEDIAISSQNETDNEAPNEEPIQNPTKRHRKTAKEWTELVGQRISGRTHKPTLKLSEQPESQSVQAVGRDLDHPTDEQARDGVYKNEWQKARQKEREQLQRYGVFSKTQGIPEGYKAVDKMGLYIL
jgi:hypothetical protein